MNALDNLAARTHVNRMCLAANVPLVESGTGADTLIYHYLFDRSCEQWIVKNNALVTSNPSLKQRTECQNFALL